LIGLAQATSATTAIPVLPGDPNAPGRLVPVRMARETAVPARQLSWSRLVTGPWPLLCVLAVQAVLALRLTWSNTAFTDEALYLWAGHLEWAHLLHGTPVPSFATYFSGAPIVYPPIAALADSIGGLAGARILSLGFMLGATALLKMTGSRLFGKRAGFFAAALWALLAPTVKLGAFATFDAMSICLLAASAWCAVKTGESREFTRWTVLGAAAMIAANAAAYSSAIFDPVIVAVALLAGWPQPTRKVAMMRAAGLGAYAVTGLAMLTAMAGGLYATGITRTVLSRSTGSNPPSLVVAQAWGWTAAVVTVAATGTVLALFTRASAGRRGLLAVLTGAALLVPAEQARIHTLVSLDKHVDFGAWLAAIAAGYAVSRLTQVQGPAVLRTVACVICAGVAVFLAVPGYSQAQDLYNWANSARFTAAFRPLAEHATGPLLVEAPSPARYYLADAIGWRSWSSTWSITLPSGKTIGARPGVDAPGVTSVYVQLVTQRFFSLIALNYDATPALDQKIIAALARSHGYRFVARVPYGSGSYVIWKRT
jgi:hypothetical protein